ncbi:CobW family GTP-binding protein [Halomonas sp. LR3S48]|uniref:CobW family GTP-binding protein n=1 Tax=Halomonas sp. LR3S48 TaxID=2982694 RepID=UPI0021E47EB5|nr:CobW family GTP-binding protein [Halomonas sp. LR3S48]UYG05806.1 CobW family GTP-binding protein [Halomonas sp. LR3S48]
MSTTPLAAISVHLFSGFLGSGKTTLIRRLIEQKPEEERWVVLVNEFGQVGIDQAMFEARDDVIVKGLPGGCLCCQLAFVLQATLVNLLHRHRPDRLIIEPSGLGHPAGLLDVLRGEAFADILQLRDIVVLLDPSRLDDPRAREHETFNDQLAMADAVALTMSDRATPEQLVAARHHAEALWPPKKWVAEVSHGDLPLSLLLESGRHRAETARRVSGGHDSLRDAARQVVVLDGFDEAVPQPGKPQQESGMALGYRTQSWRWSAEDVFDLDCLTRVLDRLPPKLRVKGVLHTDAGWKLYNRGDGAASVSTSAWRKDSRLELIAEAEHMPPTEETLAALQACCLQGQKSEVKW